MNKISSYLVLMALVASCQELKAKQKMVEKPEIYLENKTIDLGEMKQGTEIQKSIPVINKGNADLLITNVKGSCSCTYAKMSEKKIKPGKIASLYFTFHAPDHIGETLNTICLRNNSKDEFYLVKIKAEIID